MTLKPLKLVPNEKPSVPGSAVAVDLNRAIKKASNLILSQQSPDGYWWYTLEANESINAEYILLTHYLGCVDKSTEKGLVGRILDVQQADGSWPLYYQGSGDISTTIECYFALKLHGLDAKSVPMTKARNFILEHGGLSKCRVFTRIHLAQFGLVPWEICPSMPVSFMHLPVWMPLSVYEFSSWARACIIPLLVIMHVKKTCRLPHDFSLDELFPGGNPATADWSYNVEKTLSFKKLMIETDKLLHLLEKWGLIPLGDSALKKCEQWILEHINRTEDIYPALAYGAMALSSLGHGVKHPPLKKALDALKSFQMPVAAGEIPAICPQYPDTLSLQVKQPLFMGSKGDPIIYQQCCISPVWDTPWAGVALIEAGEPPSSPLLLQTGRWLLAKQIRDVYGDWSIKNKKAKPGGWSFEFQNDYFPDVDDTIEVLNFLKQLKLPPDEVGGSFATGIDWLLSMQSKNGGWAAFDVDNTREILNRIPFSDHGACLDPPTADITGRMLELLASLGYSRNLPVVNPSTRSPLASSLRIDPERMSRRIKKAIRFIEKSQTPFGAWEGRWGVNYIYGTWCVLQGLAAIGYNRPGAGAIEKASTWLLSVQNADGGFGESCHSYLEKNFIPLPVSTASQTAWGLMGLVAGGLGRSTEAKKAAEFLINSQNESGGWDEKYHTGTGFPGHFYIRYHGYRYYFPLLTLARSRKAVSS
ncbi:MAG: squalene--hopene cyclase [Deltaproteobacteria bacterium]|nr:squalene--hopene cyclase [Deltaproteobacteria bacterium]